MELKTCCKNQVTNPRALSPTRCIRCGQHLIVRNRQWVRYQPKEGNDGASTASGDSPPGAP